MVPAHHVVELRLVGCPDPDPTYTRFFSPRQEALPPDLNEIGRRYVGALAAETLKWIRTVTLSAAGTGAGEPIGVAFSGGIDSGSVFLVLYHTMQRLGLSLSRLKAFTLDLGGGPDLEQARAFLDRLGLEMFLEEVSAEPQRLDVTEAIRVIEDYKPLDADCAAMGLLLCKGIRERYPGWRYLVDGDGGDENLKDYPLEPGGELTIRSVVDNPMLYQEGWGVGRIKHSLTYSGGLSRGYVRTYAPARRYGLEGFSPYTRPDVIEVAEGVPFAALTGYDPQALYELKGEIVRRGVMEVCGFDMPVFPKRRFQEGTAPDEVRHAHLPGAERDYRQCFFAMYDR
jgi:asparagine synthase (glutamine-hydrolysing)